MSALGELVVEKAALAWLERAGWQACNGAALASTELHVTYTQHCVLVVA